MSSDKDPLFSTKLADCSLKSRLIIKLLHCEQYSFLFWKWLQLTWVEDRTGTALGGPRLWVKGDASPLDLHLRLLVQDLLDFNLYLCMGAFIVSWHYLHHQHCQGNTNKKLAVYQLQNTISTSQIFILLQHRHISKVKGELHQFYTTKSVHLSWGELWAPENSCIMSSVALE